MKKQRAQSNPYAAFNDFMIRQAVKQEFEGRIADDHNEMRVSSKNNRGRSVDIEFYDGENEEYALNSPFIFAERKPVMRAVPVRAAKSEDTKVREKKWSDDSSADREGFMEKREKGQRDNNDHENDGLESAEDKDPVLVVSGKLSVSSSEMSIRRSRKDDFSARRSG